jgi:hypothetical protein
LLFRRATFSHDIGQEPVFSCTTNPHSHLPVYTNIHRIRRDVISVVEDYLTLEQLRDVRINVSVIRPLVDKLYELDDISIGMYCRAARTRTRTCLAPCPLSLANSPVSQSTACWSTGPSSSTSSRI